MKEINIELLVQQIQAGKIKKFEKLIDYYKHRLYGYIFKQVRNKEDSEDVLQEVFIKVYRKLDQYDSEQNFTSWIVTITRNTIMDYFRRKKPKSELIDDLDMVDSETPEKVFLEKSFSRVLDNKISQLPDKYRELILLKYFEELTYDEISITLSMPINQVKWQLHQARKKLMVLSEQEVRLWNAK